MESSVGVFVTGYDLNRPLANDLQVRTLKRGIILSKANVLCHCC